MFRVPAVGSGCRRTRLQCLHSIAHSQASPRISDLGQAAGIMVMERMLITARIVIIILLAMIIQGSIAMVAIVVLIIRIVLIAKRT